MKYEKNGRTFEFELNINKIIEKEESDPTYSLSTDLASFENSGLRFSAFNRLAGFIDTDLAGLKKQGLNLKDLTEIFMGCIDELGFSSDAPESGA